MASNDLDRANPSVRLLAIGAGISVAGSALNTIGLLTYVYARTEDPVPVGIAVLANFLPVAVVLPLFGGALARRSLQQSAFLLAGGQAVVAAAMAVAAATGAPLYSLYTAAALLGLLAMAQRIAILSMLPRLVDRDELARTNILVQTASQLGAVVGAVGLLAHGTAAAWVLLAIDSATFVVQAVLLYAVAPDREFTHTVETPDEEAGGRRMRTPRRLLPLVALMPSAFIAMNVLNVAIPLVVLDRVAAGQRGYAAAEAVYAGTAIAVGLVLRRVGRLSVRGTLATIVCGFVVLAVAGSLPVALAAVAVLGAGVVSANSATQVVAQSAFGSRQLPRIQVRAASVGAALSAFGVVGVTAAFAEGFDRAALLVTAGYFVLATGVAAALARALRDEVERPLPAPGAARVGSP